jgi:hypothetical protein
MDKNTAGVSSVIEEKDNGYKPTLQRLILMIFVSSIILKITIIGLLLLASFKMELQCSKTSAFPSLPMTLITILLYCLMNLHSYPCRKA